MLIAVAKEVRSLAVFHNGLCHNAKQHAGKPPGYLLADTQCRQQLLAGGAALLRHCQNSRDNDGRHMGHRVHIQAVPQLRIAESRHSRGRFSAYADQASRTVAPLPACKHYTDLALIGSNAAQRVSQAIQQYPLGFMDHFRRDLIIIGIFQRKFYKFIGDIPHIAVAFLSYVLSMDKYIVSCQSS